MSAPRRERSALYCPLYLPPAVTGRQDETHNTPSREHIESHIESTPLYPPEARNDAEKTPVESTSSEQAPTSADRHLLAPEGGVHREGSLPPATPAEANLIGLSNLARTKEELT